MYEKYLEQLEEAGMRDSEVIHLHYDNLSGYGTTDFFVPAANARSLLYAGISLDAKNISQSFGVRRCRKY